MSPSKILSDLVDSAIAAKTHYEVWWAQASEAKPKLVGLMNAHSDFFHASYDAHYTAFFVNVAHLFDGRSDSSSIPTYFAAIRPSTDPAAMAALESEFAALSLRARPLVVARHKTVAHVDARLTEKDVFGPSPVNSDFIPQWAADFAALLARSRLVSSPGAVHVQPHRRTLAQGALAAA